MYNQRACGTNAGFAVTMAERDTQRNLKAGETRIQKPKKMTNRIRLFGWTLVGTAFLFAAGCGGPTAMNESTQNVRHINAAEFDTEVIQAASPVVVDFYATWCGPCKMLSPMLDELAGSFTNRVKFVKVNVDEATSVARRFNIEAIPTLMFFKNGKVVDTLIGLPSSDTLKMRLESLARATAAPGAAP
jgi:thioredoxin 1